VTPEDLTTGLPAATRTVRQRVGAGVVRILCCAALCAAGTPAFATGIQQTATNAPLVTPSSQAVVLSGTSSAAVAGSATLATTTASKPLAAATLTPNSPSASTTHVRPIFGDLATLQPGTTIVLDEPAKPGITDRIQGVLSKAMTLLGTPYRWGGESPENGFDCSGLVGYLYRSVLGVDLPRVSRQMATTGQQVERTALVPGDLVFFGRRGRVNHVGIYVGEGRFLHAPSRGKDVRVDSLTSSYWSGRFMQGRRVAM
jgi:cell wall-associated NlpC family hydrolase